MLFTIGDSWVDVKGNDNKISNNKGVFSILDGFQVHDQRHLMSPHQAMLSNSSYPSGCNNQFINNVCSQLGSKGVCVQLKSVKTCPNKDINNFNLTLSQILIG
jgi:hypothetical protein